ncbi:hypothetical protein TorRG33x02_179980, partial [Trema orientale]
RSVRHEQLVNGVFMAVFTQKLSQQRNYVPGQKGKRAEVVVSSEHKINGADVIEDCVGRDHEIDQQRLLI